MTILKCLKNILNNKNYKSNLINKERLHPQNFLSIMLELPSLEISLFTLASLVDSSCTHERILQNCKYHQPWLQILYSSSLDTFLVVGIIWGQCGFFLQASKDAMVESRHNASTFWWAPPQITSHQWPRNGELCSVYTG